MADLDRFDFPAHLIQDEYPAGSTVRFGRGYTFTSKPNGPEEDIFHLTFHNGLFFIDSFDTVKKKFVITAIDVPQLNVLALQAFYKKKLQYYPFIYPHAFRGDLVVRFNKPLLMPKVRTDTPGAVGGLSTFRAHQTEAFDLELILVP